MPLLEIRNVTRRFGALTAIDNVTLAIGAGEFFTLLGPSGCGKTTLLRMIAGFDAPDAGSIWLDGKDLADKPAEQRPVHTVFQSYALFPHLSGARPELAHRFIDFLLEGESSAARSNAIGAGSPNAEAMRLIRPEIASNAAIFPGREQLAKLQQLRELTRAERRRLNRMWIEIKVR